MSENQASCHETPKEVTLLHPPLPVFAPARVLFRLSLLSLLSPVCAKEFLRDQTVAGKDTAM